MVGESCAHLLKCAICYVFMSLYRNVLPEISLQFGKLFIP